LLWGVALYGWVIAASYFYLAYQRTKESMQSYRRLFMEQTQRKETESYVVIKPESTKDEPSTLRPANPSSSDSDNP